MRETFLDNLHMDVLPRATRSAFSRSASFNFLKQGGWYLAGGTALALHAGHRQSEDLDFFTVRPRFSERELETQLFSTGEWNTTLQSAGTLYGVLCGSRVSFIAYPFFKPTREFVHYGAVSILAPEDVASMKIIAISQRGRKRDFVDMFWYCKNREPIENSIRRAIESYSGQEKNVQHILKSLVYFDDAEEDPMPKLFFKADWPAVKRYFRREVPTIARRLLRLS